MPSDITKFTLKTESEILKKFRFVAEYNARSFNREIETLMKKHISEFEKANEKIKLEKLKRIDDAPQIASFILFSFYIS